MKNILTFASFIAAGIIFGLFIFTITLSVRGAWNEPVANPPVSEPITAENVQQKKSGQLSINTGNSPVGLAIPFGGFLVGAVAPPSQTSQNDRVWVMNGDMNIVDGIIKINGDGGSDGKVLGKNSNNLLEWKTLTPYSAGYGIVSALSPLSVNDSVFQRRITSCPAGQIITRVNQNGTVGCRMKFPICTTANGFQYSAGYACYNSRWTGTNGCPQYNYRTCLPNGAWATGATNNIFCGVGETPPSSNRAFSACQ